MKSKKPPTNSESTKQPASPPHEEQVATLAYLIWQSEGCPDGRDEEHWHQAKDQLAQE